MVNNFDQIRKLLDFSDEGSFYYLQILRRKKENPDLGSNSKSVKDYRIRSLEHFDSLKDEIIGLCDFFNARASIRLNRRSYKNVAFKTLEKIVNQISQDDFTSVKYAYSKTMGANHNDKNKTWIIDVDDKWDQLSKDILKAELSKVQPEGDKVVAWIPSKAGFHVITKPFNLKEAQDLVKGLDIHKDNPTNLYIP